MKILRCIFMNAKPIATYHFTGNPKIPAEVTVNSKTTPVWTQQLWDTGNNIQYVKGNGCGHCCAAMAANLHGVDIDPDMEFELCINLWGEASEEKNQARFQTVSGITKILNHLGIHAEYFGTKEKGVDESIEHIMTSLLNDKQVIFWSHPTPDFPDNPFSPGEHYVLACGFDENDKIVIANSTNRVPGDGIQLVDILTIKKSLHTASEPENRTWGELDCLEKDAGYVIVG